MPAFAALVRAGFLRYATYRQATLASAFTNSVFGFLHCYLLLAVLGTRASVGGYDARHVATFVWVGQGLIGVVQLFTWTELSDRIRSGDIAADLLRPIDPLVAHLAVDLGRAGHAALVRLGVPVVVGALFFPLAVPTHAATWPLAVLSVLLAVVVSLGTRYLISLTAFWWLDARGPNTVWLLGSTMLSGLAVPLPLYPEPVRVLAWATPFPWTLQAPLDVLLERGGSGHALLLLGGQAAAALAVLGLAALVQRRAVRALVVQGG